MSSSAVWTRLTVKSIEGPISDRDIRGTFDPEASREIVYTLKCTLGRGASASWEIGPAVMEMTCSRAVNGISGRG